MKYFILLFTIVIAASFSCRPSNDHLPDLSELVIYPPRPNSVDLTLNAILESPDAMETIRLDPEYRYLMTNDLPIGWLAGENNLIISFGDSLVKMPPKDNIGFPPLLVNGIIYYISESRDSIISYITKSNKVEILHINYHVKYIFGTDFVFIISDDLSTGDYVFHIIDNQFNLLEIGRLSSEFPLIETRVRYTKSKLFFTLGLDIYALTNEGLSSIGSLDGMSEELDLNDRVYIVNNNNHIEDFLLLRCHDRLFLKYLDNNSDITMLNTNISLGGAIHALHEGYLVYFSSVEMEEFNVFSLAGDMDIFKSKIDGIEPKLCVFGENIYYYVFDQKGVYTIDNSGTTYSEFPVLDGEIVIEYYGDSNTILLLTSKYRLIKLSEIN